ncbi:riboflavin synthase [Candidatus Daviesbacteria bacterium]|nr:riboflavin synthase [Candidatus Daviesbacteria bacterium]
MFTGIITHLGKIRKKLKNSLNIKTDHNLISKLSNGTSIAVNGICLTVIGKSESIFSVDFMPETENKTNIKYLRVGDLVNLELPATYESFLSGHIVQGHIDGVGRLKSIEKQNNSHLLKFVVPKALSKYIIEKGSIAVDGISLTVIETEKDQFSVGIIPHTWDHTILHTLKVGDVVNIEADLLAKHMEKLLK